MIKQGSSWCDLVKHADGRVEFVHLRGTVVVCEDAVTGRERWACGAEHALLYLSAAADRRGRVAAGGQRHDDGIARVVVDGTSVIDLGVAPFPFGVLLRGEDEGWTVFIQRTADWYDEIQVSGRGAIIAAAKAMPPTSQGFLYVASNGEPITQDQGRGAIPGLALASPALSDTRVWAGQSVIAETIALFDSDTGKITNLGTPGGQPPHIVESGGTFYVAIFVNGGAWLSSHRRPFTAVTPPRPPDPPKEPDVSVRDVPNLIHVIEQCRRDFPTAWRNCHRAGLPQAQAEEFARRAAYACSLVDPRFGLNGKRGDPNDLSDDCVCFLHDDGRESVIDFGAGAGGDNPAVQWSIVGHYQVPGPPRQLWIKAEPVGAQQPPAQPPATPPASRPFPAIAMPWDVQVHALTRFINEGIWPRDRVPEITETGLTGSGTLSRGALGYFIPAQQATIVAWVTANGNRAPAGTEWWPLADRIADAAIAAYRRDQPTP